MNPGPFLGILVFKKYNFTLLSLERCYLVHVRYISKPFPVCSFNVNIPSASEQGNMAAVQLGMEY